MNQSATTRLPNLGQNVPMTTLPPQGTTSLPSPQSNQVHVAATSSSATTPSSSRATGSTSNTIPSGSSVSNPSTAPPVSTSQPNSQSSPQAASHAPLPVPVAQLAPSTGRSRPGYIASFVSGFKLIAHNFGRRIRSHRPPGHPPKEWITKWLHPVTVVFLILSTLSLMGVILGFAIWSSRSDGIATISKSSPEHLVAGIEVGLNLAWTLVPVFITQTYSLWVTATVGAFAERQPFVELDNPEGAPARVSILLDYRSISGPVKVYRALKNHHWLLGFMFLMTLILSFLITPFASNLFHVDDDRPFHEDINIDRSTYFDEAGIQARTQLLPMLNLANAIQLYDTPLPGWTDRIHSFEPFRNPVSPATTSGYVTVVQNASSVSLNCTDLVRGKDYTLESSNSQWAINGDDRGCTFNNQFTHSGVFEYYVQTFVKNDCPLEFTSSDGRLFVFAAYAPGGNSSAVSDFLLISCTTSYYNTTGHLNVTFDETSPIPRIRNFEPILDPVLIEPRPQFWKIFERNVCAFTSADDTATYSTTTLGRSIIDYATLNTSSTGEAFQTNILIASLKSTMSLTYAVTAATYLHPLLSPHVSSTPMSGTLTLILSRLRIVPVIAYVFVGVLAVNVVLIVLLFCYTLMHTSILYEEPTGILSYCILTANSTSLPDTAKDLRRTVTNGKFTEAYRNGSRNNEYAIARWGKRDWGNLDTGSIVKM